MAGAWFALARPLVNDHGQRERAGLPWWQAGPVWVGRVALAGGLASMAAGVRCRRIPT